MDDRLRIDIQNDYIRQTFVHSSFLLKLSRSFDLSNSDVVRPDNPPNPETHVGTYFAEQHLRLETNDNQEGLKSTQSDNLQLESTLKEPREPEQKELFDLSLFVNAQTRAPATSLEEEFGSAPGRD